MMNENNDRQEKDKALEEIFAYYHSLKDPASQDNLVTMLREIQEICGFIPPDMQQRAADTAGVKLVTVTSLMKFYKSLKPAPYRHKVVICTGRNCIAGNQSLLDMIKQELKTGGDGLSADGSVLLTTQNCLKHCRTAPNVMVDGRICENVTMESLKEIINRLQ